MLTSFGSVMDRLQGLLSRAYLLAGFFPAVVFFSLNLGLLYAVFPASRPAILVLPRCRRGPASIKAPPLQEQSGSGASA